MIHRRGRPGFTLIEILMVVAIIGVLVALFMGGVTKVMAVMQRTEVMSDITQMAQSLEQAKAGYNPNNPVSFFPSQLVLYNDISQYRSTTANAATKQTANVLRAMFGPRFISKGTQVSWDGTGTLGNSVTLKGSECLVFYLGGMPSTSGGNKCIGFSVDPLNPTKPPSSGSEDRKGPFFQFKSHRLAVGPSGKFFRYLDPYGTPYAYFGAYTANEYAPTAIYGATQTNTDNSDLGMTDAYHEGGSPKKWFNPNLYQIISAGKDKLLGLGGTLSASNGSSEDAAKDNLANFSQTELGNPIE